MKKALMIAGGWSGHQPEECVACFETILNECGFEVVIASETKVFADVDYLKTFDVIIPCWTMGTILPEESLGLRTAILSGVGLAGWHGGLGDSFRNDSDYQFMVGGQFVCHPGNVIDYTVNITKADDPIMQDVEDFDITSEQYYMHVDPNMEILATTTFSGEHAGIDWVAGTVMPVAWKKTYGAGKVFYFSCGHQADEFKIPELQAIMTRGILWAANAL